MTAAGIEALARFACRPWASSRHYPDLLQEARIGIWQASDSYDPNRGAFSTYAIHRARGRVLHYLRSAPNTIHIPFGRVGRPDNPRCVVSTDDPDYLRPDPATEPFEDTVVLDALLDRLPPMHARAIRLYADGWTCEEIGGMLGYSNQCISRWIRQDRTRLQAILGSSQSRWFAPNN